VSDGHSGWPRNVSTVKVDVRRGGLIYEALGGRTMLAEVDLTRAWAQ
jgi:hypothetical protein